MHGGALRSEEVGFTPAAPVGIRGLPLLLLLLLLLPPPGAGGKEAQARLWKGV